MEQMGLLDEIRTKYPIKETYHLRMVSRNHLWQYWGSSTAFGLPHYSSMFVGHTSMIDNS
jgi:hypothetical protein